MISDAELADAGQTMPRNGTYFGHWGGYYAVATINGISYFFRTAKGIRTPEAACRIRIYRRRATVEDVK